MQQEIVGPPYDKKAKYKLVYGSKTSYSFVTTTKNENECINILRDKAESYKTICARCYKIVKVVNGEEYIIYKGRVDSL